MYCVVGRFTVCSGSVVGGMFGYRVLGKFIVWHGGVLAVWAVY